MIGVWLPFLHVVFHLPLAALISLDTLRNALNVLGYPAVALFIMIESMGIPFPGETMLLLASFYAALDHRLQIPLVIVCAAFGAIIGDNIGYLIGRTGGYPLVRRFGRYVFLKPEHLERAERFFDKHGNKTVFFGRFVAVLRAWAAFLAGVNRMRWSTFLIYNAAGGILWAGAALIVVAVVAAYIFFRWRRAHHAQPESSQVQPTTGELQSEVDSYAQQATPDQEKPKDEEGLHPERISSSDPQ